MQLKRYPCGVVRNGPNTIIMIIELVYVDVFVKRSLAKFYVVHMFTVVVAIVGVDIVFVDMVLNAGVAAVFALGSVI